MNLVEFILQKNVKSVRNFLLKTKCEKVLISLFQFGNEDLLAEDLLGEDEEEEDEERSWKR